jgi:predicted permease
MGKLAQPIAWAVGLRLIVAPCIAAGLVYGVSALGWMTWGSVTAQVLMVSSALPAAVNTVIISMEMKSHPDVAAGAVLIGTLLSAGTLSVLLSLF